MNRLMPTGLPGPSSTNSTSGSFRRTGLPSGFQLELHHARRADHLLGRDAVDPLGEHAHELDAAAGDDEGLEAALAQIGEQLEHGLVGELGVGALEARMAGGGEPVGDDARELVGRDAGMGRRHDLEKALLADRRERLQVALEHRLERLRFAPLRVLRPRAPSPGPSRTRSGNRSAARPRACRRCRRSRCAARPARIPARPPRSRARRTRRSPASPRRRSRTAADRFVVVRRRCRNRPGRGTAAAPMKRRRSNTRDALEHRMLPELSSNELVAAAGLRAGAPAGRCAGRRSL